GWGRCRLYLNSNPTTINMSIIKIKNNHPVTSMGGLNMQSASYCFTQVSPLHSRIGYRKCGFKPDWLLVM
ncbi:TPA: hypothetical protein ACH95F_002926, partial [Staphylococcus aureus]